MGKFKEDQTGFSAIELVLVLVIVAIIGGIGWFVYHSKQSTDKTLETGTNSVQTNAVKQPMAAKPNSVITNGPGADLKTYTNNKLGFTFEFPANVYGDIGCKQVSTVNDNNGNPVAAPTNYQTTPGSVSATVVSSGDNYYITTTLVAQLTGRTTATIAGNAGYTLASGCNTKVVPTAQLIQQYRTGGLDTPTYADIVNLPLTAAIVKQGSALNAEVQKIFDDPTLQVTKLTPNATGGWDKLSFTCSTVNDEQGCASTGGSYTLRYYPKTSLLTYWATGQACQLGSFIDPNTCYDTQIIDSFKLIN